MPRFLRSFKIHVGNRVLDYRVGKKLSLDKIKSFFQNNYSVEKLWHDTRHIVGILSKNDIKFFLKLSTTEGMNIPTKNEYNWNNYFHKYLPSTLPFTVPTNHSTGFYQGKYFYLITNYFFGNLLCSLDTLPGENKSLRKYIPSAILFSETIQKIPAEGFVSITDEGIDYKKRFITKTMNWFRDIPLDIRKKYKIEQLLRVVEQGINKLVSKPRHGDFTPWHLLKLSDSKLGLIDGEHALVDSVENYDICYFIQRVFSVLKKPNLAQEIFLQLVDKGHQASKLKTVLAARAIGGFLDESLNNNPNYEYANNFQNWILKI